MATSGSFQTNEYHGSKHKGLQFNWSRTGYDIAGNYSDIYWEWVGFGSTSGYHELHNSYLNVDGERVYTQKSGTSKQLYNGTVVASGTKRIYHNNDGTRSFSADGGGGVYTNAVNCTGSGSWDLDTIPRYANISNFSVSKRDETSVQFNFSVDSSCDWAWYSTDNGGSWHDLPNSNIVSGLSAGTGYNFKLKVRRTDSQLTSESGTYYQTTYDYPRPTSANDFNIGDGATVYLDNPLNRQCTLQLISNNDGSVIGTYSGTYNGYINAEFKTTDAIDKQYKSIPNSNSGTYYAKVTYGSNVRTYGNKTYYTKVNECSPSVTGFTYRDSNNNVSSVTGNDQILVKGLSTLEVTIPSNEKMTTQKYATPSSYNISCDSLNQNVAYSDNDITTLVGTGIIATSGLKTIRVVGYDSRGNSDNVNQDITVLDYSKPVINLNASRLNNFENQTTLKIAGTFTKLTINSVDKNAITNVKYRYRETGGSWNNYTNVSFTINDNKYTCTDVILSLDNTKSYEFEVVVTDRLQNNTANTSVDIGQSIFFISSNKRACYINGQEILMYDVVDTWND